jgi:hypothetical protein
LRPPSRTGRGRAPPLQNEGERRARAKLSPRSDSLGEGRGESELSRRSGILSYLSDPGSLAPLRHPERSEGSTRFRSTRLVRSGHPKDPGIVPLRVTSPIASQVPRSFGPSALWMTGGAGLELLRQRPTRRRTRSPRPRPSPHHPPTFSNGVESQCLDLISRPLGAWRRKRDSRGSTRPRRSSGRPLHGRS